MFFFLFKEILYDLLQARADQIAAVVKYKIRIIEDLYAYFGEEIVDCIAELSTLVCNVILIKGKHKAPKTRIFDSCFVTSPRLAISVSERVAKATFAPCLRSLLMVVL